MMHPRIPPLPPPAALPRGDPASLLRQLEAASEQLKRLEAQHRADIQKTQLELEQQYAQRHRDVVQLWSVSDPEVRRITQGALEQQLRQEIAEDTAQLQVLEAQLAALQGELTGLGAVPLPPYPVPPVAAAFPPLPPPPKAATQDTAGAHPLLVPTRLSAVTEEGRSSSAVFSGPSWPTLPTPQGLTAATTSAPNPGAVDEVPKGHKRYFIVQLRTATVACEDINYALRRDKAYVYDEVGCRLLAETYPKHPVVLLFSIIGTQHFQGYGTMKGQVDRSPTDGNAIVPVLWECLGAVPFTAAAVSPPRAVVEEIQPSRGTKVCGLLEASIAALPMGQMLLPFTDLEKQHLVHFIAYYGPGVPPPQLDLPSNPPLKKPRESDGTDVKPRKLSSTAKVRKLSSAAKEEAAEKDPLALKVWVQGLPPATSATHLKEYFDGFGTTVECVLIRNRQNLCTGLAYVIFAVEAVATAVKRQPHWFRGVQLVLVPAAEFELLPSFPDALAGRLGFYHPSSSGKGGGWEMNVVQQPAGSSMASPPPYQPPPAVPSFATGPAQAAPPNHFAPRAQLGFPPVAPSPPQPYW
eukprot:GGOE01015111.1.p1 GENE.GGOE01015111.1~~GGOE01015111.1.p1  ORF type:complete len:579 (+),score=158.77 GGOE01015111.1:146-1882(+)